MSIALDVNNPDNWELIYTVNLQAETEPTNSSKFIPIPVHVIPVTSATPILAVSANSVDALPHWVLAFYLTTSILIPSLGKADLRSYPQLLGLNLYIVQSGYEEYYFRVKFPIWHKSMNIQLYRYLGAYSNCELDGGDIN